MTRLSVAFGLVIALAAGSCGRPAEPELDHVRAVVLPYLTMAPFYVAAEEGFFAEQNLDVEFVKLGRDQEIMAALAQGDVDAAAGMLTVNVLSLAARGARVRVVAAMSELTPDHCAYMAFIARREHLESGALEDPDRLRGMRFDADILIPLGYWTDEFLRPLDLTVNDFDLVNLPTPAAMQAMDGGSIDLTIDSEPFLSMYRDMESAVVWKPVGEVLPGYVISTMMYGPTMLDERPDVGRRFATAIVKGIRRYNLGKTPRNLEIVERATGLTSDQVQAACWPKMHDEPRIDPSVFRGYQEWSIDYDLIDRVLEDDELFDVSFIEYAIAELRK
jgi:NitT/TauT family transport system substrate-binding protein